MFGLSKGGLKNWKIYCIFRITNEKLNKAEFLFNETYNTEEVDKILSLLNERPDTFVALPAYCIRDDALRIGKNDQILLIIKVANEKPVEILAADESNTSTIVDLLNQENGDENKLNQMRKNTELLAKKK